MRRSQILPALLLLCCSAAPSTPDASRRSVITEDLDRDGRVERVVLDPSAERTLAVYHGPRRVWQDVPKRWQPWKLVTADVDGDGRREIIVGLKKGTRYFPRPHNCLFVYSIQGERVIARWLGSSLGKPFTDFAFGNLDGDRAEELASLEAPRNGRRTVTVFSWSGFGFEVDRHLGPWSGVRSVEVRNGKVVVK